MVLLGLARFSCGKNLAKRKYGEWLVFGRKRRYIADDLKEKRNMLCLKCLTTNGYKRILGVARENDSSIAEHTQVGGD